MKGLVGRGCPVPLGMLLFIACSVMDHARPPQLDPQARWVLLPFLNHTQTPQAGLKAEAITEGLLLSRGIPLDLEHYPRKPEDGDIFGPSEQKVLQEAIGWAKERQARYGIAGVVDEWRYKAGVDGEPVVGLSLKIIDLQGDRVVWSGVGARTGWSQESLHTVAQKLIRDLLKRAELI